MSHDRTPCLDQLLIQTVRSKISTIFPLVVVRQDETPSRDQLPNMGILELTDFSTHGLDSHALGLVRGLGANWLASIPRISTGRSKNRSIDYATG